MLQGHVDAEGRECRRRGKERRGTADERDSPTGKWRISARQAPVNWHGDEGVAASGAEEGIRVEKAMTN